MNDRTRPDPDALLLRLRDEDERSTRGRLRIYFGASAGVGKTYAMLAAARQLQATGVDVVAGIVETHGRADTAALLEGLTLLPSARHDHRGRQLAEFDLDAALARKPAVLLVDELAHSNVAGSRHAKRWQDVEELLAAGIDVYSTLNVQHLESLNDVVGGITGIVVHETLPDTFFDQASEVVLVDTPAEELIERLAAGKVYLPAQAERAAANFFRKGNLMALRELALRRTADRVENDVQAYRSDQLIDPVWKTEGGLLCCIGPHAGAEHVVRSAAQLARQLAVSWHAVYVETPALQRLAPPRRDAILQTVELARTLGARTTVLSAQGVAQALVEHARANNLSKLVFGTPTVTRWWPRRRLGTTTALLAPDIDRIEVGRLRTVPDRAAQRRTGSVAALPDRRWLRYAAVLGICVATTVLTRALTPYFDLANIVMVFLLTVVGVALWLGRGPAVLAAFVNVAAFDFFFVPPELSFTVSDLQYLLTFAVMLAVGLITGQLTAGLRYQANVARHREERSRALFEAARDLSNALTQEVAVASAQAAIGREFHAEVAVYALDAHDRLTLASAVQPDGGAPDPGAAQWALQSNQPAGLHTDTLAGSPWLYLPLRAPMRARGVLAVKPQEPRFLLISEQRQQLETFAALTAMALERVHYVEVAQGAMVQMETEQLRNSLLSALSHDLRTPLAALVGMAELLAASEPALSASQRSSAHAIGDRARRMNDMVTNLLDMARIQSGEVRLALEWQSVEELVGGALKVAQDALGERPVAVEIAPGVPLVECDAVLIERVLVNLLENAGKYTPRDVPIELVVDVVDGALRVAVRDHGPGIEPDQRDVVFQKFTRGNNESATLGVGLGLAICRAIVQAHRGRIWAEPTTPHGATFTFTLPLRTPPTIDAEPPAALESAGAA